MKGLCLRSLKLDLCKIDPDFDDPVSTIVDWKEKLGSWADKLAEWIGCESDLVKKYHRWPLDAFAGFSFDELCKFKYSTIFTMGHGVDELFETRAQYEIVRKIKNSMWRWGSSAGTWNEVVDAYDNLRHFMFLDDRNFELRLDYSTYVNQCGYAKYSRIYIDGVFAFLVYYKRKHVMTLGFSILDGRRVLIQQVQSSTCFGNRYLFKLPENRLEFVVDLFRKNFPGYGLYVVDGGSLVEKTLSQYREGYARVQGIYAQICEDPECSKKYLGDLSTEKEMFWKKITHLYSDKERLKAFYGNTGRYTLGSVPITIFDLSHYPVAA